MPSPSFTNRRMRPLFPNEHGAWAMLASAFLLGWGAAPHLSLRPFYLVPAIMGAFLTRYPLSLYFKKRRVTRALKISLNRERNWFLLYGVLTFVVAFPLFYPLGWWWLWLFVMLAAGSLALHLKDIMMRKERTLFSELMAMLGVSWITPATLYAGLLLFDLKLVFFWLLFVGFYAQRIVVIRRIVAESKKGEQRIDFKKIGRCELSYAATFSLSAIILVRICYAVL